MFEYLSALTLLSLTLAALGPEDRRAPADDADAPPGGRFELPILTAHNRERADHGLPPLRWDARLATAAERHARRLATSDRLHHGDQRDGRERHGENLWAGTRGAYGIRQMVDHWVAERRHFVNRPIPYASRTGSAYDVGHYTQIIWHETRAVGCATVAGRGRNYLVCRYAPGGNVIGRRAVP